MKFDEKKHYQVFEASFDSFFYKFGTAVPAEVRARVVTSHNVFAQFFDQFNGLDSQVSVRGRKISSSSTPTNTVC